MIPAGHPAVVRFQEEYDKMSPEDQQTFDKRMNIFAGVFLTAVGAFGLAVGTGLVELPEIEPVAKEPGITVLVSAEEASLTHEG